jgi:hypothetical protein
VRTPSDSVHTDHILSGRRATTRAFPRKEVALISALEQEIATFEALLPTVLGTRRGQFVLIKGTRVIDYFPTEDAAMRVGYEKCGDEPFLAMEIADHEKHGAFSSRFAGPPIV